MIDTSRQLVYMANQIARNFAIQGERKAVLATADHIVAFWEPRMTQRLLAMDDDVLGPMVAQVAAFLRDRGAPEHQTRATAVAGGSDAG